MTEKHDYIIDEKFIFEQKTSLIYLKDDQGHNIELSKPAARLFNEIILLNMKKGIATRDELLNNVWEEYGLVGSNNNLNTYISEIRKKLEIIGIDPKSIVTVPKKGFKFDYHLSNIEIDGCIKEQFVINEKNASSIGLPVNTLDDYLSKNNQQDTALAFNTIWQKLDKSSDFTENITYVKNDSIHFDALKIDKTKRRHYLKLLLLGVVSIYILFITYWFIGHYQHMSIKEESNYHTVSLYGNCEIQVLEPMFNQSTSDNISILNNKLEKYNISCNNPKRIILLSDLSKSYHIDKNIAFSICQEKSNSYDCMTINDQRI